MLIVNADDFGYSPAANDAIVRSFERGLLSSTTIMANGAAFGEACALARRFDLVRKIGIHMVLTEGETLTGDIRRHRAFCDERGHFAFARNRHLFLSPSEIRSLYGEFAAQIERCRASGLPLTHADSHHHVHTELPVLLPMTAALRRAELCHVRLSDNVRPAGRARRSYKSCLNGFLRLAGFHTADFFCDLADLPRLRPYFGRDDLVIEVMVHPALDKDGALIDAGLKLPLAEALEEALAKSRLISYADLAK
jgi:predicted glycoside hydrolase/deacetylase ChbG (UPF0249 family)